MWCVMLGWCAATARTRRARLLVSALAAGCTWGWFDTHQRDLIVLGCVLALVWIPRVALLRVLAPAVSTLASASLFVYLTHWQVYPPLEDAGHPVFALVASLAVGVAVWLAYTRLRSSGSGRRPRAEAHAEHRTTIRQPSIVTVRKTAPTTRNPGAMPRPASTRSSMPTT
jgi:hypothetical protein